MLYFRDLPAEALQHRLHHRITLELRAQFLRTRSGARCRRSQRNCLKFNTDSHAATEDLARSSTDLLDRVAPFQKFRECSVLWGKWKIDAKFRSFQFPAAAVLDELAEKFLLCLNGGLDFPHLLAGQAARLQHCGDAWRR